VRGLVGSVMCLRDCAATVEAIGKRKAGGAGFEIARRTLGSAVQRREMSVYGLDELEVGRFDFVYVGSLLMHLRDPVGALMGVRRVCHGSLLLVDNIDAMLSLLFPRLPIAGLDGVGRPWWWKGNVAALTRMVKSAGFFVERTPQRIYMPPGPGQQVQRPPLRTLRTLAGWEATITAVRGDPHIAILARAG